MRSSEYNTGHWTSICRYAMVWWKKTLSFDLLLSSFLLSYFVEGGGLINAFFASEERTMKLQVMYAVVLMLVTMPRLPIALHFNFYPPNLNSREPLPIMLSHLQILC
jgi:hypothetical protein